MSVDGGAQVSQPLDGAGAATFTLNQPGAGAHTLALSYAGQGNFAASSATGSLHVDQAALTVTANNQTIDYAQSLPAGTVQFAGFAPGDSSADLGGIRRLPIRTPPAEWSRLPPMWEPTRSFPPG